MSKTQIPIRVLSCLWSPRVISILFGHIKQIFSIFTSCQRLMWSSKHLWHKIWKGDNGNVVAMPFLVLFFVQQHITHSKFWKSWRHNEYVRKYGPSFRYPKLHHPSSSAKPNSKIWMLLCTMVSLLLLV